jgi:23S rRNA-/tRNA-specific pseudouridylate synthase
MTVLNFNFIVIHRLDRLTSGVVIFAKNPELTNKLSREIKSRSVLKFYLARVSGHLKSKEEK